jgi:hypothetical protein
MGASLTPAKFIKGVFSILQEHMTLHIQWLVLSHSIEPAVLIKIVKSQDSCMITGLNPLGLVSGEGVSNQRGHKRGGEAVCKRIISMTTKVGYQIILILIFL